MSLLTPETLRAIELVVTGGDKRPESVVEQQKNYRHFLSLDEKMAVVEAIERMRRTGQPNILTQMSAVAERFGISRSSAYQIYRNRERVRRRYSERKVTLLPPLNPKPEQRSSCRPPRRSLSLLQKLQVIEMLETRDSSGRPTPFREVGRRFGISATYAFTIYMRREELRKEFLASQGLVEVPYTSLAAPIVIMPEFKTSGSLCSSSPSSRASPCSSGTMSPPSFALPPQPQRESVIKAPEKPATFLIDLLKLIFAPKRVITGDETTLPNFYTTTSHYTYRLKLPTRCEEKPNKSEQ